MLLRTASAQSGAQDGIRQGRPHGPHRCTSWETRQEDSLIRKKNSLAYSSSQRNCSEKGNIFLRYFFCFENVHSTQNKCCSVLILNYVLNYVSEAVFFYFLQLIEEKEECLLRTSQKALQRETSLEVHGRDLKRWVEDRLAAHDPAVPPTLKRTLSRGRGRAARDPVTGLFPLTRYDCPSINYHWIQVCIACFTDILVFQYLPRWSTMNKNILFYYFILLYLQECFWKGWNYWV